MHSEGPHSHSHRWEQAEARMWPRLEALRLKQRHWTWPLAGGGAQPPPQGARLHVGGHTWHRTQRRGHAGYTCVQLGQLWESLNDARTSNPACPLRGHSRHPEDFCSQGILVIRSKTPGARVPTPRRTLCSLHRCPHTFSQPAELVGKLPCLQGSPRGAPSPLPNITATSTIRLDASTCRHT